jgi:TolB-like protein/tetratricopeptide (TPR) repeat protein
MADRSLFTELRERKVVQSAAIYGAVAWGVTEIVVTIVEQLFLPQWVSTLAVIFFVVGVPVAMFLSWTFDLTSDGIRRTEIKSRRGTVSIALSMLLLVAGTAGLFFLIKPGLDDHASPEATVAISPNSVAVLPFDYAGPNSDDGYLGPGLSDELRDQLGRVAGIQIAARSSSIAVVQEGADAMTMARKLRVGHLLEGNMRRQGSLLRVSVRLINGSSGLAVWNKTFDRGRAELLNVQQDIAQAVANTLLPGTAPEISAPITEDATAHEKILLARSYEQQVRGRETVDPEVLRRAIQLYREAIELDPESALAHSRLAGALIYYGDIDAAEAPAYRALELDPGLAEAQNTWGKYLFVRGRPNMGEPLARAVELNPNLPEALADYAWWHWVNVGPAGVAELYERALDLDPLNVGRYGALGVFLAVESETDRARDVIEQLKALFDTPDSYRAIANIYDIVGDVDHAIAWTIKARNAEPDNPGHVEKLAEYYVDIGDFETAEALWPDIGVGLLFKMRRYDEMIDRAEELVFDYPEDIQLRVYLAAAYNRTGLPGRAIQLISNSGMLDSIANGLRGSEEVDAFYTLVDAAYTAGDVEDARDLANGHLKSHYTGEERLSSDWWISVSTACLYAIVGDDAAAYERLQRVLENNHLAWDPLLKDSSCFKRFQDDPAYQAVVEHFDGRRAMLRDRLPATLADYGVVL